MFTLDLVWKFYASPWSVLDVRIAIFFVGQQKRTDLISPRLDFTWSNPGTRCCPSLIENGILSFEREKIQTHVAVLYFLKKEATHLYGEKLTNIIVTNSKGKRWDLTWSNPGTHCCLSRTPATHKYLISLIFWCFMENTSPWPRAEKYSMSGTSASLMLLHATGGPTWVACHCSSEWHELALTTIICPHMVRLGISRGGECARGNTFSLAISGEENIWKFVFFFCTQTHPSTMMQPRVARINVRTLPARGADLLWHIPSLNQIRNID